jgi:hypothetical protein
MVKTDADSSGEAGTVRTSKDGPDLVGRSEIEHGRAGAAWFNMEGFGRVRSGEADSGTAGAIRHDTARRRAVRSVCHDRARRGTAGVARLGLSQRATVGQSPTQLGKAGPV